MDSVDITKLSNENILELLQVLITPNSENDRISLAQNLLKKYIDIPQSIEGFIFHLSSNQNENIRQLSAIMLYKSIEHNWENLDEQKQDEIKKKILELYSKENINKVIKSIGISIYKICKKILLANKS